MVNTFLTHSDFDETAQNLDPRRRNKQKVEAYQILCLCEDLNFISDVLNMPKPTEEKDHWQWIRDVVKVYKKSSIKYIKHNSEYKLVTEKIFLEYKNKIKYMRNNNISYQIINQNDITNKNDNKDNEEICIYATDRIVNFGFGYHPAVQMWLGYEDALKGYINSIIKECLAIGYKNNMEIYNITKGYMKPQWVYDSQLLENHRAALYKKEIVRKENSWYANKPEFVNAKPFVDYYWPITKPSHIKSKPTTAMEKPKRKSTKITKPNEKSIENQKNKSSIVTDITTKTCCGMTKKGSKCSKKLNNNTDTKYCHLHVQIN